MPLNCQQGDDDALTASQFSAKEDKNTMSIDSAA